MARTNMIVGAEATGGGSLGGEASDGLEPLWSELRHTHALVVSVQAKLRALQSRVEKSEAVRATEPQPAELKASLEVMRDEAGTTRARVVSVEERLESECLRFEEQIGYKAERAALHGKVDKAFCEKLVSA